MSIEKTIEELHWVEEAVAHLIQLGMYTPQESEYAYTLAENLLDGARDLDDILYITPKEAVDEELTYWGD